MPRQPIGYLLAGAFQIGLQRSHDALVGIGDKARSDAFLPSAAGATDAVAIVLNGPTGHIIVDHMGNVGDVQAATCDVGSYQYHPPAPKCAQVLLSLLLSLAAMKDDAAPPVTLHDPPHVLGVPLFVDEDYDLVVPSATAEHSLQLLLLL